MKPDRTNNGKNIMIKQMFTDLVKRMTMHAMYLLHSRLLLVTLNFKYYLYQLSLQRFNITDISFHGSKL
jgi:hypothetical protein